MSYTEFERRRELCNCGSLMECQAAFSRHWYDDDTQTVAHKFQVFKILICLTCDSATVLLYTGMDFDEDWGIDQESGFRLPIIECRKVVLYAPSKQFHDSIPPAIAEVVKQAKAVLSSSPRASFVLCRVASEEICNDFKIPTETTNSKGKSYFINLHERLSRLFRQEQMPEELQTIMNGIKDLGNEGAHSDHLTFAERVKEQDAVKLIKLVNHVLRKLYIDRYSDQKVAEELKELKSKII